MTDLRQAATILFACFCWTGSAFGQENGQQAIAGGPSAAQALASPSPQPPGQTEIHSGAVNLDINYPGAGVRYFLSDKTALEARVQFDKKNLVEGARLYWYPAILSVRSPFSPYLCAEGDHLSFNGTATNGTGFTGGAFAGVEYSLGRSFSLQMDMGGEYFSIKDRDTSLTQNELEFVLNFGVNLYLR